jgi:uncharacterized protein (DUF58 family)
MIAEANVAGDVRFLDPEVASKLASLEMIARFVVEGFMIGLHRSPYHGYSVEFSSYRKYVPGDDLRFVDWKVLGRTDRYYVKEFEENTNLTCHLLLDCSGSMAIGEPVSKFRYAQCLAAALAYLMVKQGDQVGLVGWSDKEAVHLPPGGGTKQLAQVLSTLEGARPRDETSPEAALSELSGRKLRRGLIVVLSDLLADVREVMNVLKRFRYRGSEVVVFQILAAEERDFPFTRQVEFIDAETDERMTTHAGYIRDEYLGALRRHVEELRRECRDHWIELVELSTVESLGTALAEYLARRQAHRMPAGMG